MTAHAKETKKPFHEVVAERLIEQLKAGTAPWQRPWESTGEAYLPMNPTTGKRYRGINAVNLLSECRNDARWLTYKQAATVNAQVRKGEKGTLIQYWKPLEKRTKLGNDGNPALNAEDQSVDEPMKRDHPYAIYATVFNAEQMDGLPPPEPRKEKEQSWSAVERIDRILKASNATIKHVPGEQAAYYSLIDTIVLPMQTQFSSAERYYAVALHELGHWTGHKDRLQRDLGHPFGSISYAREELRAEIASMIVGGELGIGHDPDQHAAYVASWIKILKDDPREIFRAAADAEKIRNYVMAFEVNSPAEQ